MKQQIKPFSGMSAHRLDEILSAVQRVKVVLLGDVCLDVYWHADMRRSELSRETPHFPLPVVDERMSLGGGGNVAANLASIGAAQVSVVGAVGQDWRGRELTRLLEDAGIGTQGLVSGAGMTTNAYIKPMRGGISDIVYEDPRLDFAMHQEIGTAAEDALLHALDAALDGADVLCVSDQMRFGVLTPVLRRRVVELAAQGLRVIVDSRERIAEYAGATLKPNEVEGARAVNAQPTGGDIADYADIARKLSQHCGSSVFLTAGALGSVYTAGDEVWHMPAHAISGPIDFVGAGDSSLAGFSLALAAGAKPEEAAFFAGLCSEITIQQIGCTGAASPEKLRDWRARVGE